MHIKCPTMQMYMLILNHKKPINRTQVQQTLFAHIRPHALHRVLGPAGPRRIAGVLFSLTPQC